MLSIEKGETCNTTALLFEVAFSFLCPPVVRNGKVGIIMCLNHVTHLIVLN